MKVWESGKPEPLRALLPERRERREIPEKGAIQAICKKGFSWWAPPVINQIRTKEPSDSSSDGNPVLETHPPRDEEEKRRQQLYEIELREDNKERRETHHEGRVVVWTDGSAKRRKKGKRAGAAVFYGEGNKKNSITPVTGSKNNIRAELTAVLHVLENEDRPINIRTDCLVLVKGVQSLQQWKERAWWRKPTLTKPISQRRLWWRIERVLSIRGDDVRIEWVKGHATRERVRAGTSDAIDAWGNSMADKLAKIAAGACITAPQGNMQVPD
jgi:ribonuclease HI